MKSVKSIILFLSIMLLFACTKEKNAAPIPFQYAYYPLAKEKVWIYDVDSTAYSNFTGGTTNFRFQIKDSIADFFIGLTGDTIYRIERYKKEELASNWIFQKTIARSKSLRAAEETLDNQTFVRLIFPPSFGASWNGNTRNNIGEQNYLISEFETDKMINNINYNNTLTVTQIDDFNLIREDFATETYAKDIGLIRKEVKAIDKDISTGRTTNGFIYSMEIVSNN